MDLSGLDVDWTVITGALCVSDVGGGRSDSAGLNLYVDVCCNFAVISE